MIRTIQSLLLLAVAPAGTLAAQAVITLPAEYERAWGQSSLGLFSAAQGRYQVTYSAPFALGTTVTGIGIRRAPLTEDRPGFTVDLEIRASSGPNAPGGLSGTFANNVGSDEVVVLPQQTIAIPAMPANRGPGEFASIPFQVPFVFGTNGNTNLVFEVRVFGISSFSSWQTDRVLASVQGRAINVGMGCGFGKIWSGSGAGIYVGGSTTSLMLIDGPANGVALLIPAFDLKEYAPGVRLPLPLAALGAGPGCDLMVNPLLGALASPINAMGVANATVPIPAWFGQAGLGFQWAYLVPPTAGNPLGLELTNVRSVWIGPEVCEPAVAQLQALGYPFPSDGLANTGSAPIMQITTQ